MAIDEHRIDTAGIAFNVREAGDGPLVICLHGITANAAVWDPVVERLMDRFRVVAVDQRGHGKSDKPASGYGGAEYAQDVLDLIEAYGGAPALVVGHSLGARNGVVAACMRPDMLAGVVAVDFTPFIEPDVLVTLETRVKGGDRTFASVAEIESYLASRYPIMPADAVQRRARHGYRFTPDGWVALADPKAMGLTAEGLHEDFESPVAAVRRPVLMVRGADSKLVSAAAFQRTCALRPDLPTLVVPGTDHYVPEEAPDLIAQAIRNFAATVF